MELIKVEQNAKEGKYTQNHGVIKAEQNVKEGKYTQNDGAH